MDDQSKNMNCNLVQERLEAYVLDLLDADEHLMISQHLEGCPECRRLAEELLETAHLLPQALAAASKITLPSSIKNGLMEEIRTPSSRAKQPFPFSLNGRLGWKILAGLSLQWPHGSLRRPFFALIILTITIVSLLWNARLSVALANERSLRAEFANLVDQQELVLEVIDSNKTSKVFLGAEQEGSRSYGKLFTRSDMADVVVMAARLPQPFPGQVYHLWVIDQGKPVLAGTLRLNDQGFGILVFKADRNGSAYDEALLVMEQPDLNQPLGTIMLRSERSP